MWSIPNEIIQTGDDNLAINYVLSQLVDPDTFLNKVKELYTEKEKDSFDIIEFKDGKIFERYSQSQRMNGIAIGRVWSFRDVTKRCQMEEALRESEERYRNLSEGTFEGVAISIEGKIIEANEQLANMLGYESPSELIGRSVQEFVTPESLPIVLDAIRTNKLEPYEHYAKRKDGSQFIVEARGRKIQYRGQTARMTAIRDITKHKEAENALRQSNDFNNLLLETIPFGMNIVDEQGKILFMSKTMREIAGKEGVGNFCWEVYKDNKEQCANCPLSQKISFDKPETIEVDNVLGGKIFQISHIGLIYNGRKAILEVFQDVTEQKKLQQELIQNQKMLSIGTLAGGIAHDFNNLLGIILGYVSLLYTVKDNQERFYDSISAIKQAVDRGAALVRQILTFARKTDVMFEPVNVSDTIKELVSMLQQTFPEIITFNIRIEKNLPYIYADRNQIHQALLNLCVNSRDAMPSGGEITIQAEILIGEQLRTQFPLAGENLYVAIYISDTGTGIDESSKSRIFDPFFTTKEKGKGTGLGLSVVYGIVKAHHGFIDVESALGRGTTFKLYFPVPQDTVSVATSQHISETKMPGGNETILVVEDEDLLLQMVQILLETHGYKVLTAKDGYEAIEVYSQNINKIDLVLTDMGLPKLTGKDEFIKLKKINNNVKVLIASGFFDPDDKVKLEQLGIKGFLQKPYVIDELLTKIREALA